MPPRFTSGIAFEQRRRARHSAGAPTYEVFFRSPPSFSEKLPNVNLEADVPYAPRIIKCHLDLHHQSHSNRGDDSDIRLVPPPMRSFSALHLPSQKRFLMKI